VAESLIVCGFDIRAQIVWSKNRFALGRGDYHWQHEPCWYAVRKGTRSHWQGARDQSTLWSIAPAGAEDTATIHGTQKPVEAMRRPIVNNSERGDLIYEPFCGSGTAAWARALDFRLNNVPELNVTAFRKKAFVRAAEIANGQSLEFFEAERSTLDESSQRIRWIRPSEGDPDVIQFETSLSIAWDQPMDTVAVTGGGSIRGTILHKLMEELLTGELEDSQEAAQRRAAVLVQQLVPVGPPPGIDAQELANTALRTFSLPELASERQELVPEVPVYGRIAEDGNRLLTGRADAVRYHDGRARIVFDWKSDVAPQPATRAAYAHQLSIYVDVLGAERGAVIYMTAGQIEWVDPLRAIN
jgi:CRISPR-associated exonuclease Cas4